MQLEAWGRAREESHSQEERMLAKEGEPTQSLGRSASGSVRPSSSLKFTVTKSHTYKAQ